MEGLIDPVSFSEDADSSPVITVGAESAMFSDGKDVDSSSQSTKTIKYKPKKKYFLIISHTEYEINKKLTNNC